MHIASFKTIVQRSVITTNPYWPFSFLNRLPYHLAVKTFRRSCRKFSAIESVYVKGGFAEPGWVPGLSDIDLVIVIKDGLDAAQETLFLGSFWKHFDSLKTVFPMLGECIIACRDEIENCMPFNRCKHWLCVYGDDMVRRIECSREKLRRNSILSIFDIYYNTLTKKFFSPSTNDYLFSCLIERFLRKVCEHSVHDRRGSVRGSRIPDAFSALMQSLGDISMPSGEPAKSLLSLKIDSTHDMKTYREPFVDAFLDEYKDAIGSIMGVGNEKGRLCIIFKDTVSGPMLADALRTLRQYVFKFRLGYGYPLVVTERIFNASIFYRDPLWWYHAAHVDRTVFCSDGWQAPQKPGDDTILLHCVKKALYAPFVLRDHPWIKVSFERWLFSRDYDRFIRDLVRIKLLLETGIVALSDDVSPGSEARYGPNAAAKYAYTRDLVRDVGRTALRWMADHRLSEVMT